MKVKKIQFIAAGVLWMLAAACAPKPFFSDASEWKIVQQDFEAKKSLFRDAGLWSFFDTVPMNRQEREALTFLYAYMPIGDITDYSGSFYLQNVRASFEARSEMPWGSRIPEKEFRHFVLPLRVNNENLDSSRTVFYAELKDRVKNLSLYEAVLEVNHWCHEKAVYTPSDARTSSPLATVKTAYGRCGEESTFLVAALRSVGIPARQVYTPRWAHTDDNHAWVEAWVDGEWFFLGACEPEPVLNLAWFNAPAARGMLMHTKVFGRYPGPEDIMQQTPCYTEINVIGNYADTASVRIRVADTDGKAVPGIPVEFKLYNYAEFFTVATKVTDRDGFATLTAGKGDMLVWAARDGRFGFAKVSFGKDRQVNLVLEKSYGEEFSLALDIVPPAGTASEVRLNPTQREENARRLAREDSIRNAYTGTFHTRQTAGLKALELGVDSAVLLPVLTGSRGNYAAIEAFLQGVRPEDRSRALAFLLVLAEKDWRDVSENVLVDHFTHTPARQSVYSEDFYIRYVMNPRVEYEMLSPYKRYFAESLPRDMADRIRLEPSSFARWVRDSIRVEDRMNPLAVPVSPKGVYTARLADSKSRNVFFVSVLRSLGVAARLDPVTGKTQYALTEEGWQDVDFAEAQASSVPTGSLQLTYRPLPALPMPVYYSHFTLSRYDHGRLALQTYPEDESSNWQNLFGRPQSMDTGYYIMVSGTRLAGGEVLSRISALNIQKGALTRSELQLRDDPDVVKVIGQFNSESSYFDIQSRTEKTVLQTTGRGYFVIAVLGVGEEPSNHALRDMVRFRSEFEQWGRPILFLFPDERAYRQYLKDPVEGLPATVTFGIDAGQAIENELVGNLRLASHRRPLFIVEDTFNRVVFVSQGYQIGLGEHLTKVLRQL